MRMKSQVKKWMHTIVESLKPVFARHVKRIYLEGRRLVLKKTLGDKKTK